MKLKYLILSAIASGLMLSACGPQNGPEDPQNNYINNLPEVLRNSIGAYLNEQVILLSGSKKIPSGDNGYYTGFDKNLGPFKVNVSSSYGDQQFSGTLEKTNTRAKISYSGAINGWSYFDYCYENDNICDTYTLYDDNPRCFIASDNYNTDFIVDNINLPNVEDSYWPNYFCIENFNYAEAYTITESESEIKFHYEDAANKRTRSFTMDKSYNLLSVSLVEGDLTYNLVKQPLNEEITIPNFDYSLESVFESSAFYCIKNSNSIYSKFSQKISHLDDDNAEIYSPTYVYNDKDMTHVMGENKITSYSFFSKYNFEEANYKLYYDFDGTYVSQILDNNSKLLVGIDSDYNSVISSVYNSMVYQTESIFAIENWDKVDDKIYQLTPETGSVEKYIIYISNKGYIEKLETYFRNVQYGVYEGVKTRISEIYDIGMTNFDFNEETSVDLRTYLEKGFDLAVQNPTKVIVKESSGAGSVNNTYTGYEISFDISDATKEVYRLKDTADNETVYVHSEGTYVKYIAGTSIPIDEISFNSDAGVAIDIANRFKELSTYDLSNISNINVSWKDFSLYSQSSEEYGSQSIRVKLSRSYFDSEFFISELDTSVSNLLTGNYLVVQKTSIVY